jgi:Myb-like DNA-binding domain
MSLQYLLARPGESVGASAQSTYNQQASSPARIHQEDLRLPHQVQLHRESPPSRDPEHTTIEADGLERRIGKGSHGAPSQYPHRPWQSSSNRVQLSANYSYGNADHSGIQRARLAMSSRSLLCPPASSGNFDHSGTQRAPLAMSSRSLLCPPASSFDSSAGSWNVESLSEGGSKDIDIEKFQRGISKKSLFKRERIPNRCKRMWTSEEDDLLRQIAGDSPDNWNMIGVALPGRTGKQCRERWLNNLRPDIRKGGWSREEDDLIIREQAYRGNQWSAIARMLPGRSDNAVKNRYNATLRKYSTTGSQAGMTEGDGSVVESPPGSDVL